MQIIKNKNSTLLIPNQSVFLPNNIVANHQTDWPMEKYFDVDYFNSLSDELKDGFLRCIHSGLENPDSRIGCYAMNTTDYQTFRPFFSKVSFLCILTFV